MNVDLCRQQRANEIVEFLDSLDIRDKVHVMRIMEKIVGENDQVCKTCFGWGEIQDRKSSDLADWKETQCKMCNGWGYFDFPPIPMDVGEA